MKPYFIFPTTTHRFEDENPFSRTSRVTYLSINMKNMNCFQCYRQYIVNDLNPTTNHETIFLFNLKTASHPAADRLIQVGNQKGATKTHYLREKKILLRDNLTVTLILDYEELP